MLVLSRREREHIRVGDSIVVTVVRVAGDKVRLGIEAPSDMLVLRGELETLPPDDSVRREVEPKLAPAGGQGPV
jgi:carbon storage regulator